MGWGFGFVWRDKEIRSSIYLGRLMDGLMNERMKGTVPPRVEVDGEDE